MTEQGPTGQFEGKNEMYRQLKQGYVSGKEYKDDIQTY